VDLLYEWPIDLATPLKGQKCFYYHVNLGCRIRWDPKCIIFHNW